MIEAEKSIIELAKQFKIFDRTELAHLLAQCSHESAGFTRLEENLNYSPEGLMKTWPGRFNTDLANKLGRTTQHPADQRVIANHVYNGRMGNNQKSNDGYNFRGRGFIQLTGKENYTKFDNWLKHNNLTPGVIENPDLLTHPEYAALSAIFYWQTHNCGEYAIKGNVEAITKIINGGLLGLKERKDLTDRYQKMLMG